MRPRTLPLRQFRAFIQYYTPAAVLNTNPACFVTERQLSSQAASTSGFSSSSSWNRITFPLLGIFAAATAWVLSKSTMVEDEYYLLPLDVRQRIFFKYEKRIRDQSSLDKVFEYFSSREKDGQEFLTPVDMLCAVMPTYPPSESTLERLGNLDGERRSASNGTMRWRKRQESILQQFDVDGDGLISYPEFLLLLTLLSIPGKDVKTIFDVVDLDGNGYIDLDEFKVVMELLGNMANVHTSIVGRSKKLSIDNANSGLLVKFFGKDGKKKLYLPEFRDFLDKLHEELVRLEFAHYDCKDVGSIPAIDFGRSLVATADIRHIDQLLNKVDSMGLELAQQRISLEEFQSVHSMRRKVHTLVVALDFYRQVGRVLAKDDFVKLLNKLVGVSLSRRVVDIIFALFDDGRGGLDVQAFLEAMQRREVMWARRRNMDSDGASSLTRPLAFIWSLFQENVPDLGVRRGSAAS